MPRKRNAPVSPPPSPPSPDVINPHIESALLVRIDGLVDAIKLTLLVPFKIDQTEKERAWQQGADTHARSVLVALANLRQFTEGLSVQRAREYLDEKAYAKKVDGISHRGKRNR